MTRLATTVIVALCLVAPQPAGAQSNIRNADLQTRAAGDLARTFRELSSAPGTFWIGYAVPAQNPEWSSCCYANGSDGRGCCGHCAIEDTTRDSQTIGTDRRQRAPVALEGGEAVVLIRVADGQVDRVRTFSHDCEVDAGGRRVHWLTGVQASASVALLSSLADARPAVAGKDKFVNGAILSIAAHGDTSADRALERLIAPERPLEMRKQAAFWAGQSRGRAGYELVRRTLEKDADDDFRRHAVFALSQSKEPESTDALIALAKNDASGRIRGEALFWLAQKAGRTAAGTITEAIENDPDTKVKERAVFALSQLPKDEGVPKLIEVARTNRNPKVRKQAMFWLGQSKDPRALKFFEEVLSK